MNGRPHSHHGHGHGHGHTQQMFAWAMWINLLYSALEAGFGIYTNSLALISDALHNLGDAAGLALAWLAAWMATRAPTDRHTFGWRRATLMSPLANALLLVGFSGALLWESVGRLQQPPSVPGFTVMWVAALGIAVNLGTAALFHRGQRTDLNKRGAYLHLLADAAVSLAAVIAGLGIWLLGWNWLDAATGILVAVVVGFGSWGLLKNSMMQVMDAVPESLEKRNIEAFLISLPEVTSVHHVHIWSLGAEEIALTAHIVRTTAEGHDAFIDLAGKELLQRFNINHATLQIELGHSCAHDEHDHAPHF
jgi:cobalt-zinc-cadmium efflux system protein